MNRPRMFATLIDTPCGNQPGDLVVVEVPHNCAVYAASSAEARDIAWSWFALGSVTANKTPNRAMFERMWDANGITPPRDEDE